MSRHLALLRGVNLAGRNSLPMKDLIAMFADAGAIDVKTYIQSGNVVFSAPDRIAKKISEVISKRIKERFGFEVPLVTRSVDELRDVIARNPFLEAGEPEESLHVYFLADVPSAENASKLDPDRSHPDRFILQNREVYLQLPNGMGRTKLSNAYFDSKLKTISTARNWRTVLKLHEMLHN